MRNSREPKYRKYAKGYGFGDKYGKKLMPTLTKTGTDAAKTASKWLVQKTAEATDLIGNKIADKITSLSKTKCKEKKDKKSTYHQKKTSNYWWPEIVLTPYKNGISKSHKLIWHNTRWSA